MNVFEDKVAIVTGGASGIGRGLVEELSRRGAIVVLADINESMAVEVAERTTRAGGRVTARRLDVADFEAVKKLVMDTVTEHGRLDYMFNNAGIAIFAEARDFDIEEWRRIIDVDLNGPVNGVAAAYPLMVEQGFGHIVNTASLGGLIPASHLAPYVTCKHGVVGLSNTLRIEGASLGVKVSVVCPGLIKTAMYNSPVKKLDQRKLLKDAPPGMPPRVCAHKILKGVEKNKPIIIIAPVAHMAYLLFRVSPRLMLFLGTLFTKNARRKYRVEEAGA